MPRDARVRHSAEIRSLLERGKRERTRSVDVFTSVSPASRSRLGVIVPKHGHRIVDRNLLKRRLKEIGRTMVLPGLEAGGQPVDILIRTRPAAYSRDFEELAEEVRGALRKLWPHGS